MKKTPGIFLFTLLLLVAIGQREGRSENTPDVISDLVWIVSNPQDTIVEIPIDLADVVSEYYADTMVGDDVPNDVLTYLVNVYSEHGYHDTGNWGGKTSKKRRTFRYVPYKGSLPEWDNSYFRIPARGILTSGYGFRKKFNRFHHGVDVALNAGDSVVCALPGVVIKTGYDPGGYGRYVVVAHSGEWETLYGHLGVTLVSPGKKIEEGGLIGLGGTSGNATGPHLHFETRYRGIPIDPTSWFKPEATP